MAQSQDWFSQFEAKKPTAKPTPVAPKQNDWFSQFDEESAPIEETEDESTILAKLYDTIFNAPKFVTDAASRFAESITTPELDDSMMIAMAKGFAGGATEGAAAQLSPANILTMGRGRIPQIAGRIIGGAQALHGGHEITQGNYGEGIGDIAMGALMGSAPGAAPELPSVRPPRDTNSMEYVLDAIRRSPVDTPRPDGPWMGNPAADIPTANPDDIAFRIASERQNMGLTPPQAEFLALDEGGRPLFNVIGGESDKSTVTAETLRAMGITAPEVPPNAVPMRGSDLRELVLKQRQSDVPTLETANEMPSIMNDVNKLQDNPNRRTLHFDNGDTIDINTGEVMPDVSLKNRLLEATSQPKSTDELASMTAAERTPSAGGSGLPPNQPPNQPPRPPSPDDLNANNAAGGMANPRQKDSLWSQIRDANRAILTSFDFSAPGRQGKPLLMTKAYWTSFDDMFKSWGSQKAYDNVMESIQSKPSFQSTTTGGKSLAERAKLSIGDREEAINSNIAERLIPGVKRSARAYSAFLNKLRADHFDTMVADARRMGLDIDNDDTILKQIGSFINDATGRGSLGSFEKAAPILNEVFFAPKLMASRVNMYKRWLNPKTYGSENPIVREQALKSLMSTVGFGMAAGELARLAGAKVSNDPTSSDFRKIKVGDNTRIDPFSGFQQYAVGVSRLLSGELTSSKSGKTFDLTSGKFGMPTRASVVSQFAQNKLAPIPSLVWSWMEGKDWDGEPFEAKKALLDRTVPIVMQDLYKLTQEDPTILGGVPPAALGILPMFGEGVQTYGR